jgi:hypothetical protein
MSPSSTTVWLRTARQAPPTDASTQARLGSANRKKKSPLRKAWPNRLYAAMR